MIQELTTLYEEDINSDGEFLFDEFENLEEWKGREWTFAGLNLKLFCLNGFLQLYISPAANTAQKSNAGDI
ncbi:MAG: hypothetical protein IPN14_11840 [Bacteroidetes bacterium]|nr:hypothetical protein [Bacteroidota bacterium]